jgi:hypothetical protein
VKEGKHCNSLTLVNSLSQSKHGQHTRVRAVSHDTLPQTNKKMEVQVDAFVEADQVVAQVCFIFGRCSVNMHYDYEYAF